MLSAQATIGVDIYNRYVWRGTDYGNAASVQPTLEYSMGGFTIGAWGAWAVNGAQGGNENDLFVSTQIGPVGLTVTDYFFPEYIGEDDILDDANHIFEISAGMDIGPMAAMVATNVHGDDENSTYIELGYKALTVGFGNGFYSTDGEFMPVNIGITAKKDNISVSYILNPDQETSFLVVGMHF